MVEVSSADPDQMTVRARLYISIAAAQNLLIGIAAGFFSDRFAGDPYRVARAIMPVPVWGALFFLVGLYLVRSAHLGKEGPARGALALSVCLTSMLGQSFYLSFRDGGPTVSPVGVILCLSLVLKDIVVASQPLRSPFERVFELYGLKKPKRAKRR